MKKILFLVLGLFILSIKSSEPGMPILPLENGNIGTEFNGQPCVIKVTGANDTDKNLNLLLNNKNIGVVKFSFQDNAFFIDYLKIEENFRNKGYGSFLIQCACGYIVKNYHPKNIYVYVSAIDGYYGDDLSSLLKRLIKFYKRNGFVLDRENSYESDGYESDEGQYESDYVRMSFRRT